MWLRLIISLVLVHCLLAMPRGPESDDQSSESWSLETACQDITKTTIMKNQNDPTCASYVYCYFGSNGPPVPLVKSCKSNTYFDDTIKMCTTIKPDSCTSDNQTSEFGKSLPVLIPI